MTTEWQGGARRDDDRRIRVGVRIRPATQLEKRERRHEAIFLDDVDPQLLTVMTSFELGVH